MSSYKNYERPYEFEYIPGSTFSVDSWWKMIEQRDNWIQKIALIVNSITPHNVGCERVFSVLGWMCSKRRSRLSIDRMNSLAKLHMYYVSNASTELNYSFSGLTEEEFFKELNKSFNDITEFSEDDIEEQEKEFDQNENEKEDLDQDNEELQERNEIIMEKYFDINEELQKALGVEIRVLIEQEEQTSYDHGEKEFDINALLDSTLK
jgi:predicted ribosome quality control (RQC) complex YloA/Tae2 family protein